MSCENNRHHFFNDIAQEGSQLVTTFGDAKSAHDALEKIYQTARARAKTGNTGLQRHAEAHTRALFSKIQDAGYKAPTHAKDGLPKKDAQFGYAAVHQTLQAIAKGDSLPGIARAIMAKQKKERTLSAVDFDQGGRLRCSNCGQFASPSKPHLCPMTANAEKLSRSLQRYLGVNENAYDRSDLGDLLESANADGTVTMRHNLTGERIETTLDGLPLALSTGFSPLSWTGEMKKVELPDGRVVRVRNPEDFPVVEESELAEKNAAAAYGLGGENVFSNATVMPELTTHLLQGEDGDTSLSAGQDYDKGHFMGTEYRKRAALGTQVEAAGEIYTVGSRSQEMDDWSSARINGHEPAPRGGVAAGRTLVRAVGILSEGEVVRTGNGFIQVYDADRRNLLAVYDPATNIAGDTLGNKNASPAQMAAVLAHRALHPQNEFDLALSTDLARVQQGSGTPLAAADSAYITMKNSMLDDGGTITLGAKVGARRCPRCGQFMGASHNCPVSVSSKTPDLSGLGAEIASALRENAPAVQPQPQPVAVHVDSEPFAEAIREALGELDQGASRQAVAATDMEELRDAMTTMAHAVETIGNRPVGQSGEITGAERFADAVNNLSSAVQNIPMGGTPLEEAGAGKKRCPRCGQYAGEGHVCPPRPERQVPPRPKIAKTAQEHIFSPVQLPVPDPHLDDIPEVVGGALYQPLQEDIPALDPNFEINEQTERIMRSMSAMLQAGQGKEDSGWSRAFGLYGPAGTGKNTLARQLAASIQTVDEDGNVTQGMNYVEANITPESSMQELIGTTVLEKDPESGTTVSRARLGKVGLAAAMGSVISVNEIVRNPKLATALQSMMEDGEIQIDSPEQGMLRIPVHPSTVFVMTWNPGNEGDPDRPAAAPLSRITPFRMDKPSIDEQANRVKAQFASIQGRGSASSIKKRRKELQGRNYAIPKDWSPSDGEIMAATRFVDEVASLSEGGIGERQIGLNSDTPTAPGQRQLTRFVMLGKTAGWDHALDTLKIVCDQDSFYQDQWRIIEERFRAHFGDDGNAIKRREGK